MLVHRTLLLRFFISLAIILQNCGCGVTCTVAPSISGQPSNQTVIIGQPALFTVAASGSPSLAFQWLKNGTPIPGANLPSYITPALSLADSDSVFTVTVRNRYGTITSSPAALTVSSSGNSNIRFVAPTGNDSNPGTIDQPYQTLQHCATAVTQGGTCAVRAGTYRETVTPNSGITIEAYNFESVVVDGSDPVTGWVPYQGSIYKANVSLWSDDTNQIFVGSEMMTEARWPDGNDVFHVRWAVAGKGTDSGHIVDSDLPMQDWTGATVHLWSGTDPFSHETGTVTSSSAGQLAISLPAPGTCPDICPAAGGYYYLLGTLNALDAEEEWYYEPSAGVLYFMAPGKANPNSIDVRAKRRQYAFDLRGKSGVTLRDMGIFASTVIMDQSSADNTLDRMNAEYVSQYTQLPVGSGDPFSILQTHECCTGIVVNGTGNIVQNSTIAWSAGDGIALEGNNNTIRNNLIQNVDYSGDYTSGIVIDGTNNEIEYNTINTTGRQSILMNGVTNEDIGHNNLYAAMVLSRDGAAIYTCCNQVASGTRIHHNWIHDTTQVVSGLGDSGSLSGIYIDNGSHGFDADQNVLWNNQRDNIYINGAGIGLDANYIHNNTIPDRSSDGVILVGGVPNCTSTRVVDNRVAVSVLNTDDGSPCAEFNNTSSAPGATEMTLTTEVGCNFAGCSTNPPPGFGDGNAVTPCPVTWVASLNAPIAVMKQKAGSRAYPYLLFSGADQMQDLSSDASCSYRTGSKQQGGS